MLASLFDCRSTLIEISLQYEQRLNHQCWVMVLLALQKPVIEFLSVFMPPSSSSSSYELCRHHRRCALACVRVIVTACGACTHAVTKAALRNAACAPAQDYCRPLPAAAINLVRSPWMPACLPVCMQLYCRNGFMRPVLLRLETYM